MMDLCVLSNNAVCVNELPGHLHVPAGLVDEGEVEGNLPRQIQLIVWHTLQEDEWVDRMERGMDKKTTRSYEAALLRLNEEFTVHKKWHLLMSHIKVREMFLNLRH